MSYFKFTGIQSPERRPLIHPSARSPFCTSPSQLQDVTSDQDVTTFGYSMGIRSPTAVRGRSVKEFEEQLTNLRKENFNLKLRIYFLEERMGTNFNLDKESAVKKNIELMVEVESLRKELQEKQDLLCQAVKAMELEEDEHKKESLKKDEEIEKLLLQHEELEQKLMETEGYINRQEDTSEIVTQLKNKISYLENELMKEKEHSTSLENMVQMGVNTKDVSQELNRKDVEINHLYNELHELSSKYANSNQRMRTLEAELDRCNNDIQKQSNEIELRDREMESMTNEIEALRNSLTDAQDLYRKETKKVEKFKTAVMMCNNKMVDLEKTGEAQKMKIRNLEIKLESVQNEVKQRNEELDSVKSPTRRKKTPNTDTDSFSVPNAANVSKKSSPKPNTLNSSNSAVSSTSSSPTLHALEAGENVRPDVDQFKKQVKKYKEDLAEKQEKILKLKSEQFKACQIIKTMISTRGEGEKEMAALKRHIEELQSEMAKLKAKDGARNENVHLHSTKSLHETISEMNFTAASVALPTSENENSMAESMDDASQLAQQYKLLTMQLEKQIKVLMDTLKEKDSQMQAMKEQFNQVCQQLKEKENHITDLEFELLSVNSELSKSNNSCSIEKEDCGNEKVSTFWLAELEDKDKEIERLETELRKRTCDLQGLVNKELWEKNREIERLQNRFGSVVDNKDKEIAKLERTISAKETQLSVLKDKITELGVEIELPDASISYDETKSLREQLKACLQERKCFIEQIEKMQQKLKTSSDTETYKQLQQLKADYKTLREELEKSEQLRTETNEVCYILSTRLEELAQFLDSLLQQKSVLGFLGWKGNKKLKQIVNQSLDLSRALSVTISQNPDQSLMQLSNISNLLNMTRTENASLAEFFQETEDDASAFSIIPADISLTYQSHLQKKSDNVVEEQARIIAVLRKQIENLKREVEVRDTELNKLADKEVKNDQDLVNVLMDLPAIQSTVLTPKKIMEDLLTEKSKAGANTSTTLKNRTENQSESESWSEPDRTVSLARIGLDDDSLKPGSCSSSKRSRLFTSVSTESTEDEMSRTLTRTPSKRSLLAENRQTIIALHEQVCELENKLKEAEVSVKEEKILNGQRQKQLDELLEKLSETEQKLVAAEKRRVNAEEQAKELRETVEHLEQTKHEIVAQLECKNKKLQDRINELEVEKQKAADAVKKAEIIAADAKSDMREAENKLRNMQQEVQNVRQECEHKMNKRLENAHRDFENQIQNIEKRAEKEIQNAHASIEQMQAVYEREYLRKSEVDRRILEVEIIVKELENLKEMLKSAERKMQAMEEQEFKLKEKLRNAENQHREKINELRKDLDIATLQYSETVLEKTKITNEKAALEQKIKAYGNKENDLMNQVMDFQKEVAEMKEAFQKQISISEHQKSKLEVHVSELESVNAELRNKLIKLQTGVRENPLSVSLPTSPNRAFELYGQNIPLPYRRQCSDNSGYTSEEQPLEEKQSGFVLNEQVQGVLGEMERHQANSSPDLGIESDQGRFSSYEAAVTRPLLQTLELTESMSNLLDGDNNRVQDTICNNERCCQRTRQMMSENYDLKRHLLRTRRALEETATQLTIANQRKKQVEKTICKQIHKTSQVLRKAKANLDSGSETDVCKK